MGHQTDRQTHTQTKYRNPRCACVPRLIMVANLEIQLADELIVLLIVLLHLALYLLQRSVSVDHLILQTFYMFLKHSNSL